MPTSSSSNKQALFYTSAWEVMSAHMVKHGSVADLMDVDVAKTPKVMPEDMSIWPDFVEAQLRQSVPTLNLYQVEVEFLSVDEETKTAFGRVRISAKPLQADAGEYPGAGYTGGQGEVAVAPVPGATLDNPQGTTTVKTTAPGGNQKYVDVPIIIDHQKLEPMDLMVVSGKVWPLTVDRLKRALFRPDIGDDLTDRSVDDRLESGMMGALNGVSQLSYNGLGDSIHITKSAAAFLAHVVGAATPQTRQRAVEGIDLEKVATAGGLNDVYAQRVNNMVKLAESAKDYRHGPFDYLGADDPMAKIAADIIPQATVFYHLGGGQYVMKTASADGFYPVEYRFNRAEALTAVDADIVKRADAGEVVTNSVAPQATIVSVGDNDSTPTIPTDQVQAWGVYRINTADGFAADFTCFPGVLSFGSVPGHTLTVGSTGNLGFMEESQKVVGTPVPFTSINEVLPVAEPRRGSSGFFVFATPARDARGMQVLVASEMVDIISTVVKDGQRRFRVSNVIGEVVTLIPSPEVSKPVAVSGDEAKWLLPLSARWVPVLKRARIVKGPATLSKAIADDRVVLRNLLGSPKIRIEGRPVDALPSKEIDEFDELPLVLALLGVPNEDIGSIRNYLLNLVPADTKVRDRDGSTAADTERVVVIHGCRHIKTLEPMAKGYLKTLQQVDALAKSAAVDLHKQASVLADPDSVDAILSLNYISGETLADFVAAIPLFEEVLSKMSELLLAIRMGQSGVSEDAVATVVHSMEKVIDDLNRLKYVQVM